MIRQQSLYAVAQSSSACVEGNVLLTPVPSSPLADLCLLTAGPESFGIIKAPDRTGDDFTDIMKYSQQRDMAGVCLHDAAMENVVDLASKVISSNLDMARNQVNPIIKSVVESAIAYADSRLAESQSPMNIITSSCPAPYNNPILAELVSRYGDTLNNEMQLTLSFPVMSAVTIREKCQTGISRLDSDINSWITGLSDEWIDSVYNAVFCTGYRTLTEALSDLASRPDKALLIFLLARRFMEDLPDGLNIGLAKYKEYVSGLMSQAGRQVVNCIRRRADNDRMNFLIVDQPGDVTNAYGVATGNVKVNGDVYARWLAAGGTPEVIFGALQGNVGDLSFNGMLANADKHVAMWRRTVALMKTRTDFDRFNFFLEGMRRAVMEQILTLHEDLRAYTSQTYKERLTEVLSKVKAGGVDEPWAIGRKLVCRVFFPHTEAERVLWAIADQCKAHPDMDVREAALLATIEIVSDWVAKQFTVGPAGIS